MFNGDNGVQYDNYVSDYPQVFFTQNYVNKNNSQMPMQTNVNNFGSCGVLGNFLNSDMLKQILPFLLNGKNNNGNANFMSMMQNFNPNISKLINSLGMFNNKNNNSNFANKNDDKNIIDMNGYEEIK